MLTGKQKQIMGVFDESKFVEQPSYESFHVPRFTETGINYFERIKTELYQSGLYNNLVVLKINEKEKIKKE